MAGTLASRVLGLARDAVIAASFARGATDLFWLAFTIPNSLRVLLGEGAVSGAFVPVLTEVDTKHGPARTREVFARLAGVMIVVLGLVAAAGVACAPWLVTAYAAGFRADPGRFQFAATLTSFVFPYIFFAGVSALATAALNTRKKFAVAAFSPAALNVALIAAPLVLVGPAAALGLPPIGALALAVLAGGLLQVAVHVPALKRVDLLVVPRIGRGDPEVRKAMWLLGPLLLGLGVYQLNIVLSRQFASFLPAGSLSYLYYGQRIVEIPQGMFALAVASAGLPALSEHAARGDREATLRTFRQSLRLTLFVAVPSTVALAVLAEPAVAVVIGRGAFGAWEIQETARSLFWQACGIWAVASVRATVPMFHAAFQDTKTPVWASAVNVAVFAALSWWLMKPLAHEGLAIAFGCGAVAQLAMLFLLLRRKTGPLGLDEVFASAWRMLLSSAAMGALVWTIVRVVHEPEQWSRGATWTNLGMLSLAVVAGVGTYGLAARMLGVRELREIMNSFSGRSGG